MAASARNVSEVRFLTAKGEMRSSPATTAVMEEGPTDKAAAGKSRGVGVGGRQAAIFDIGFTRRRVLGPEQSDRKQRRPPEAAAGEKDCGTREDKGIRYQQSVAGSRSNAILCGGGKEEEEDDDEGGGGSSADDDEEAAEEEAEEGDRGGRRKKANQKKRGERRRWERRKASEKRRE